MSRFRLRTLGAVELTGPSGAVPLEDPRLVAFLVMLAVAGDDGIPDDELLLRLTPDATAPVGRATLARLASTLRGALGDEATVTRTTAGGYALAPGTVSTDVRLLAAVATVPNTAFLAQFRLPDSPEFGEWLEDVRPRIERLDSAAHHRPARRMLLATAVAALILVAAAAAYRLMPDSSAGFTVGDPLLLADVRNETGDPELDNGLRAAAIIALQQSGRIRLYPR
jgi:DNA-binding SARP family transcriptional activator